MLLFQKDESLLASGTILHPSLGAFLYRLNLFFVLAFVI
jgi:hypothetical protein